MGDKIKRAVGLRGLSMRDANIEKIDSLNDLVVLYSNQINSYLNEINPDITIQNYIKSQLKIN